MRGEVLKPDDTSGPGLILGEDGRRYNFITPHVHKQAALAAGAKVDFIGLGEEARDIYVLGAPGSAHEKPPINVDEAYKPVVATRADGFFKYFFRTLSKNYFQFYGRARRKEYWSYFILWIISLVLLATADAVIAGVFLGNSADYFPILTILFFIYCIV